MANPMDHITKGALMSMWSEGGPIVQEPILQVLQVKQLSSAPGSDVKYRVVLSDTVNFIQSMLVTGLNHLVISGALHLNCFVKLKKYTAKTLKGRRVVICQDLEVAEFLGTCPKLGEPQQMASDSDAGAAATTATSTTASAAATTAMSSTVAPTSFYGNRPPQQAAAQSMPQAGRQTGSVGSYGATGPMSRSAAANFYTINQISPYTRTWSIKARCANKSAIRTYHNKNGEGKLFNATFIDATGEIRATGFNEQVDKFFHVLEEGAVYCVSSPCRVAIAKKQFSNVNNDYELMFESDTVIERSSDEMDVPQVKYDFTPISDLPQLESGATTDVIGILKNADEVTQIVSKASGKPFDKRELTLVDNSGYSVRLTVWNETARAFSAPPESVLAFKGVKVSDFGGRSLSLLNSGTMATDPDMTEAHRLRGWFDAQGRVAQFTSHAGLNGLGAAGAGAGGGRDAAQSIAEVRDANLGTSETPDYFSLKATIMMIKQEVMCYPACLSDNCNKKVIQQEDGSWRCERCNINHPKPQYRYILLMNVCDHTGQLWLNCFDDVGRLVMGCSADEYSEAKEMSEKAAERLVTQANFQTFLFRCRAKQEFYQEMPRTRVQIVSATPIDASAEANRLAELIKEYSIE